MSEELSFTEAYFFFFFRNFIFFENISLNIYIYRSGDNGIWKMIDNYTFSEPSVRQGTQKYFKIEFSQVDEDTLSLCY